MAKVTVTIEGDIDEVVATLHGMAGRFSPGARSTESAETISASDDDADGEGGDQSDEAANDSEEQQPEPVWTASYVHTFWRNLSDTARQAMIRVSRSPNHTQKRAQLMHTLQLSQRELSGSLSSQGHSLNRLKRRRGDINLPRPLTYDKTNDAYVLDDHFADALTETGLG